MICYLGLSSLYADLNGQTLPAIQSADGKKSLYQVKESLRLFFRQSFNFDISIDFMDCRLK